MYMAENYSRYSVADCEGKKNLYNREKPLTANNKLSPPLP